MAFGSAGNSFSDYLCCDAFVLSSFMWRKLIDEILVTRQLAEDLIKEVKEFTQEIDGKLQDKRLVCGASEAREPTIF